MRKTIAAVTAGLLLVAGQAAAANDTAVSRVGDRVGARVGAESSEFAGVRPFVLLIAAAVIVGAITVGMDDGESD
jgi:hypothetical protein